MIRGGLLAKGFTVEEEFDAVAVGVDLDRRDPGRVRVEPAAVDVDHRCGGPLRLIEIKRILAGLAVRGDQPLVVATVVVAFVAVDRSDVEHDPDERAPEIRCLP